MNDRITLTLDRRRDELSVDVNDTLIAIIWDITGVKRVKEDSFNRVRILRNGRQIGNLWEVEEIKERW